MYEVLAFSAFLTAVAFFISSFAVFWPEYRAAQKRESAGTDGMAETKDMTGTAETAGALDALGAYGTAGATGASSGPSGNRPRYNHLGPEDMKRYLFNYPACPAAEQEEEEKEGLAVAAWD